YSRCLSIFLYLTQPSPISTLFPYTTLFRSVCPERLTHCRLKRPDGFFQKCLQIFANSQGFGNQGAQIHGQKVFLQDLSNHPVQEDRKSTRLNSSHVKISYAVFCLKKKKQHI